VCHEWQACDITFLQILLMSSVTKIQRPVAGRSSMYVRRRRSRAGVCDWIYWWHGEAQVTVAGGQLTELLRTRVPTFETGREKSAPLPANFRTF
jgi:hypothetical protein